jgi:S1-C subfamily serine protease
MYAHQTQADDRGRPAAGSGPRRQLLSGAAGGLVVAAVAGVALATGVVHGHTTRVVEQPPPSAPAAKPPRALDADTIYAREAPGVAFIRSSGITSDTPLGQTKGVAEGSGIAVDTNGDILTNAHVVDGARRVAVRFAGESSTVPARVLGKDDSNDLAVLHVDPTKVKLDPLPLGGSRAVRVGDPVVAIGNPFGLDRTITAGIVSALQRQITAPDGFTIDHVIQTDAAINPGNSGGPLIDGRGRVIGINSQIAAAEGGDTNIGLGFAIPIDTAKAELRTLERGGTVAHVFLGVATMSLDPAVARAMGLRSGQRGALVERVRSGSPATKAGLRGGDVRTNQGMLLGGDVIVSLDNVRVDGAAALSRAVAAHRPGQTVALGYLRSGERHVARVKLGTRPA